MSIENKNMLGALLVSVAFFAFWSFVVPEYDKISQFKTAIEERQKILDERKAILDKLKSWKSEYEKKKSQIASFSTVVPTEKEIAEVIVSFETMAKNSGLIFEDVTVAEGGKANDGSITKVTIEGTMQGTYDGLRQFLANIETSSRIIDINKLSILPQDAETGAILNIGMKADAYFIK